MTRREATTSTRLQASSSILSKWKQHLGNQLPGGTTSPPAGHSKEQIVHLYTVYERSYKSFMLGRSS